MLASNTKEYYQAFVKNKNKKLVSRSKIITQQPKTIENPNIIYIKLVFLEYPYV